MLNNICFIAPTSKYYITTSDYVNNASIIYALSSNDVLNCSNVTLGYIFGIDNATRYLHSLNFNDTSALLTHEKCYNKTLNELEIEGSTCTAYQIENENVSFEINGEQQTVHKNKVIKVVH